MREITDIIIIGAGPVGLFAIFEAGMHKMKCHVIDALPAIGGQCIALYPEKPIYDIPAYPSINGQDLVEKLIEQATPFHPVYHMNQRVEKLFQEGENWVVATSAGKEIQAKAVIVAAGCGAFGPNRLPLDGIEAYEGKSVLYYVPSKQVLKDQEVVIAGGGDSALDWALLLHDYAKKIYMVHRRSKFRASPASVEKLHQLAKAGHIELVIPYQLEALQGKEGKLSGVVVKTLEGEEKLLKADYLLAFFGLSMELGPIAEWGLGLDNHHIQVDPSTMQTNREGIYAIGDIATYKNKLKLILTGFAEAAHACRSIYSRVYPNEAFHFEYSTTKGIPGSDNV